MGTSQTNKKFKNIDKKLLKFYANLQPDNKDKPSIRKRSPRN